MAEAGPASSQGKGVGDGNCCGQAVDSGSISACVFCSVFFSGAASRLRGVKPHADERSEKVRWLSAGSVSKSQVSCSNSVKRFSSGFAGVVQAAFGIG